MLKKINIHKMITMFLTLMCVFSICTNVKAEEAEQVEEDTDGVVKVVAVYEDDNQNIYYIKQGSGFVIGTHQTSGVGSEAVQYVFTDYGNLANEVEITNAVRKKYGLSDEIKFSLHYYAVGNMGVMVELELVSYSNETGYAILKPERSMPEKDMLKLANGDGIEKNAQLTIEGYSGNRYIYEDDAVEERTRIYSETVIESITTEAFYEEELTYFTVGDKKLTEGMAGAPVLDVNGCVVGMMVLDGSELKALSVENIRIILDSLDVDYMVTEDDATYDVPTEELKNSLITLIREKKEYLKSIDRNLYTEKTWESLYTAVEEADKVVMNSASTKKEYEDSINAINKADKKLRTKNFKIIIFNVITAVVVIIMITFIILQVKKRKKLVKERG